MFKELLSTCYHYMYQDSKILLHNRDERFPLLKCVKEIEHTIFGHCIGISSYLYPL